jgi:hypothetical protein
MGIPSRSLVERLRREPLQLRWCDVDNEEPQETPKSLRGVSRKTVYAMVAADEGRTSERANPRRSRPTLTRSDVVLSGMDR